MDFLKEKAKRISYELEQLSEVNSADFVSEDVYDVRVIVDEGVAKQVGLTPQSIANTINGYVSSVPLGSYRVGDQVYDYRFQKSISAVEDLTQVSIPTPGGSVVLGSLARIVSHYDEDVYHYYGS